MSQWRIVPAGVQQVLDGVLDEQQGLGEGLTQDAFAGCFDGLAWGGALTSAVASAVQSVMVDQQVNLEAIGARVSAGVAGVGNATIAYNQGQEDMIGTFQSEMSAAAVDGDLTYFVEHGAGG